jgi:hypothetical protein
VGPVHQVHATWVNKLVVTEDAANQGAPLPGLAGRVYLFGPDLGLPVKGTGKVIVDLFDAAQAGPNGESKMLERWVFTKENLDRLLRKDVIGWGYTLFLPWPDYQPAFKRLQVQVSYLPETGVSMYGERTALTLLQSESTAATRIVQLSPGATGTDARTGNGGMQGNVVPTLTAPTGPELIPAANMGVVSPQNRGVTH